MQRFWARFGLALRRAFAKADTFVAIVALWWSGASFERESWALAIAAGLVGLVFLISSGDFIWRKGYVAGQRGDEGPGR